jgi:hypothetical protein
VRRLVSEGTRPKLPWAKKVTLNNDQTAHLLTQLHGDGTRYVTRSVANHLNDIAKTEPALVMDLLANWCDAGRQNEKELAWMTRHALRTLVKQGHRGALLMLGYRGDVAMQAEISLGKSRHAIGDILEFSVSLKASEDLPVLVDYRVQFARPDGKSAEKVFKLKSAQISAGKVLILNKKHHLKGDATTFTLHPGPHRITLQVNGADLAWADFNLQR